MKFRHGEETLVGSSVRKRGVTRDEWKKIL